MIHAALLLAACVCVDDGNPYPPPPDPYVIQQHTEDLGAQWEIKDAIDRQTDAEEDEHDGD